MDLSAEQHILSLASGIGGLDLAVRLALEGRTRTVCYVEREAFAIATLVKLMQAQVMDDAPVWSDVRTFDGTGWHQLVDGIIGGYPCQPYSNGGKRNGKQDKRDLAPEFIRIVSEVCPKWCFFENVGSHLNIGFAEVKAGLENLHYCVTAGLFSASEVGAPHERQRLFILALKTGTTQFSNPDQSCRSPKPEQQQKERTQEFDCSCALGYFPPGYDDIAGWERAEIRPTLCGMAHGDASDLDEYQFRAERLRALGNAVVPLTGAFAFRVLAKRARIMA